MPFRHTWLPAAAVAVYAAGAAVAHQISSAGGPPLCLFRLTTGVPCPGCGTTRAGLALLHGNLGEALHQNPLAAVLLVLLVIGLAAWGVACATGHPWQPRLRRQARTVILAALGLAAALNWAYLITRSPSRVGTQGALWAVHDRE